VLDGEPDRALGGDRHVREDGRTLRIGHIGDFGPPAVTAQVLPEGQRPVIGGLGVRLTGLSVDQQPCLASRGSAEVGEEDLGQTLVAEGEPHRARGGSGRAERLFVRGQGDHFGRTGDRG
jgi:hypothetical protein